jgi:hypothetical protein
VRSDGNQVFVTGAWRGAAQAEESQKTERYVMIIVIAACVMFVVCSALYGWGLVVRRLAALPTGTWPMTVALGLSCWIFLGGILNLARLARPWALYALIAVGTCITLVHLHAIRANLRHALWPKAWEERIYRIVWCGLVVGILGFTLFTQLSPSAFNTYDDFQKYFVHVARMVQTGTLYGSTLNTLGSETLGGQAFLQGITVANDSFAYINAADAIFCFMLTILLAGGLALGRPMIAPIAVLAILLVWLFEPQYVSVTALYSAAALIFSVVTLSVDRREYVTDVADSPSAAAIGLIYAALVALKPTFALFAALHFLACTIATVVATREVSSNSKRAVATAMWGLAFISPWAALYGPLYWSAVVQPTIGLEHVPVPSAETINLISTKALFLGGSYIQYTSVVAIFVICAGITLARQRSNPATAQLVGVCCAVPAAYLIMMLVMGPLLVGYETALRHFLPVLIGTAPAALILCGWVTVVKVAGESEQPSGRAAVICAILAAAQVIWFVPDALTRAQGLARTGSMLAYLRSWTVSQTVSLLAFDHEALEGDLGHQIAAQQQRVPAGEPLLVWTAAPFLFNFTRNPIIDIDIGGTATPWSRTPPVHYILWQYAGFGIRQLDDYEEQMRGPGRRETYIAATWLAYAKRVQGLLKNAQIIFNDGNSVLMRIEPDIILP